ncbi:uncharacterized protein LOC121687929 isoform X2 [Alosa sapidissima]|uniref:uncharacterized protein LOC121687929 isoform X2 n=1 Tax=Alosa sapidissima TaxID=34773 RepID=UPI001C09B01C|nr:uncharacterized protein LOC121687929 isoform X2 [Alosa sapidissima]
MKYHLFLLRLLVTIGNTESQHLSSVTKVCVQSGKSITIPFLYDQKYKGYKKICQRGFGAVTHPDWEAKVHNGNNKSSKTMSMSDDVTNSIFTLTVRMDVGVQYTNVNVKKYSCAVVGGGPNNEKVFTLLDTDDIPELRVQNQTVFGYEGGTVAVDCLHKNLTGEKKWCRIDGSCLKGEVDGMSVETVDAAGVFRVTLRNLQEKNNGWYWCSVGTFQMPFHITVSKRTILHTTITPTLQTSPTTEMSNNSSAVSFSWKHILGTLLKSAVALVCLTLSIITAVKLLKLRAALSKDDRNTPNPSAE